MHILIKVTETHHLAIEHINRGCLVGEDEGSRVRRRSGEHTANTLSTNDHRPSTEEGETWVTYGLKSEQQPVFIVGRISDDRSERRSGDPDFILDCGFDYRSRRRSMISAQHFRLYYNHYGAWMFEDTSRHGCFVNGHELFSARRAQPLGRALNEISLRPDTPNEIDLRCLKLKIEIGDETPYTPFRRESLDLSRLGVHSQAPTASVSSDVSGATSFEFFPYYVLSPEEQFPQRLVLMSKLDGKPYVGYMSEDLRVAIENYQKLRQILDLGSQYGIVPFVDFGLCNGKFVAVTDLYRMWKWSLADLEAGQISFVFVQNLERLAFLHEQDVRHGNITKEAILLLADGDGCIETKLTDISLRETACPASVDDKHRDVTALSAVIKDCFTAKNIDWEQSPLGPYLLGYLDVPTERRIGDLARRILFKMKINEQGDVSPLFRPTLHVWRRFPLTWVKKVNTLLRQDDLHEIINAVGLPRIPHHTDIAAEFKYGEHRGRYITLKTARKLLEQHGLHCPSVPKLEVDKFTMTTLKVGREVQQHMVSGMVNISQVFDIIPGFATPGIFTQPEIIQDVRGDSQVRGFYVSMQSLASYMTLLRDHDVDIGYTEPQPPQTQDGRTRFQKVEFQKAVIIPTGWAVPRFVQLSRQINERLSSDTLWFSSVSECQSWFQRNGLNIPDGNLQQPLSAEWRSFPFFEKTERLGDIPESPSTPPSSSKSFRFRRAAPSLENRSDRFVQVSKEMVAWQTNYDSDSNASTIKISSSDDETPGHDPIVLHPQRQISNRRGKRAKADDVSLKRASLKSASRRNWTT